MQLILDDTVDYSKIERGQFTVVPSPGSLASLVGNTVTSMTLLAQSPENKVSLSFHCDAVVPGLCLFDVGRIQQAVGNLISNAIKFSKHDGSGAVTVTMKSYSDCEEIKMKG